MFLTMALMLAATPQTAEPTLEEAFGCALLAIALRDEVSAYIAQVPRDRSAVLCSAALRPVLADLLLRSGVRVDVLSYAELPAELQLAPAGMVAGEHVRIA